jgi:hypothetical protein
VGRRLKGDRDAQERRSRQWERRPGLSRALRVAVFDAPAAASFGMALLLGHALPRATGLPSHLLWIAVIASVSLLTLFIVERATRRLLPLAALLNLSLVFPDKAPARFAVARRSGRPSELRASYAAFILPPPVIIEVRETMVAEASPIGARESRLTL